MPKDVKEMLVQRARSVYWKKWAAKHEHEELNEGSVARTSSGSLAKESEGWIGPKSIVMWPERFSWKEDGRKRDFSILAGRGVSQCLACRMEKGTEKHRLYHCSEWHEIRQKIPEASRKWEQKAENEERVEVAKRYRRAPSQ